MFLATLCLGLVFLLSACTPYNGSVYSNSAAPKLPSFDTNTSSSANFSSTNTVTSNLGGTAVDSGVQALFDCTKELGYNQNFNANDYQNCLQITQATLSDYAFNLLSSYILTWADYAIDTALSALGFTSGRSLTSTQAKSSQLTSIISTGYRWY